MEPTRPGPEDRTPPALADHLVEEIFVRVGDFADLARASAACKAFCGLITDSTFLRRYRALHPPLLLGFLDHVPSDLTGFFIPAGAPHPNAPAARALAGGASDFRFFHLPHPHRQRFWSPCDARHGHVLLAYCDDDNPMPFWSPELAVGDPLTGRNTLVLPPVPDNLLDSAPVGNNNNTGDSSFDAFFDPSVSYNEAQFRVMWWSPSRGAIFIYSSVSNDWTLGASVDADLLEPQDFVMLTPQTTVVSYVNGCLYRKHYGSDTLIKLNISSMEFSVIYLPLDYEDSPDVVVVEDGEGTIWICHLDCTIRDPPSYFIRQLREDGDEDENEHAVDTPITLPDDYDYYCINSAVDGYIFIQGCHLPFMENSAFFSLEMKTMKLERILSANNFRFPSHVVPYFGYPPFMSSGRI